MESNPSVDRRQIDGIIESYGRNPEALLMILQDISEAYNYVPPEVVPLLAEELDLKESLIYSVATFYKALSLEPRGKYIINVCTGTACHVRGADKIIDALEEKLEIQKGQTTADQLFTLESVRCIGCCASGPVITVNRQTHGGLDRSDALQIIDDYKNRLSNG